VLRRREAVGAHPREDAEEGARTPDAARALTGAGLDQPGRHHPALAAGLPGRQGGRHPEVHQRGGAQPQDVRRAARDDEDQRDGDLRRRGRGVRLRVRVGQRRRQRSRVRRLVGGQADVAQRRRHLDWSWLELYASCRTVLRSIVACRLRSVRVRSDPALVPRPRAPSTRADRPSPQPRTRLRADRPDAPTALETVRLVRAPSRPSGAGRRSSARRSPTTRRARGPASRPRRR